MGSEGKEIEADPGVMFQGNITGFRKTEDPRQTG